MKPKIWISIDAKPEIDLTELFPFVKFDGIDNNSPVLTNSYQDTNVNDGSIFNYASFGKNIVNAKLDMSFGTYYDYKSKRQQLYNFFMQKKIFRIRTDAEPMLISFLRPVGFNIDPFQDGAGNCFIEIPFENPSGYKFSRFDSLNQIDSWDEFPLGWELPSMESEDFHYVNKNSFTVLNPSGVPIDPYASHHDLKIIFHYDGGIFSLVNKTNGSFYEIKMPSRGNDDFILDGVNTFVNGQLNNQSTNFGNIKLEPGINELEASTTIKDVRFKFPFIYV